jgi:hypothetical protein
VPVGWAPRLYRASDAAQVLSLYALAFRGLRRDEAYLSWKFSENPAGARVVVAERDGGEIFGLVGGLHVRAQAAGRAVLLSQAVDVMVDPGARRSLQRAGTFILLLARLIEAATGEDGAALMFGLPNQDSDRVTQEVFGWRNLHQVTRVVRCLTGAPAARGSWRTRRRYAVRPLQDFAPVDALWARCRGGLPFATIRDATYLAWRYDRCPHVRYHTYLAWDRWRARPAGLLVLRLGWEGGPLAAVVDWLVPRGDAEAGMVLLAQAEADAARAGLGEVAAWFPPGSPEQRWFLSHGYRAEPTRYPLPTRSYDPDLSLGWVARHWYYTMGDSDIF